jgi:hypothetical protein
MAASDGHAGVPRARERGHENAGTGGREARGDAATGLPSDARGVRCAGVAPGARQSKVFVIAWAARSR